MEKHAFRDLSEQDRKALDILSQAQKQYERYLRIANILDLIPSEDDIEEPPRSWDHPLTLIIGESS
ncbi:MAG: hypothetical protein ABIL06_19385 [Pseudomonadota bacterium]